MHSCQSDFLNFYSFLPYLLTSSPVCKFMHWLNISTRFRDGLYALVVAQGRKKCSDEPGGGCAAGRRLPLQHP